jgi:hypothetical protein
MSIRCVQLSLEPWIKRANDCETSMKSLHSAWLSCSSMAVLALFMLAATPAASQVRQRDGGESTGSAAVPRTSPAPVASPAPAPSAPVSTPTTSSSAGSSDSGSSASDGRSRSDGGGRTDRGNGGSRAGTARPRDGGGRTAGTPRSGTRDTGESQGGHQSGATARRTRDGGEVVGTAVRRPSVPDGGGSVIIVPGGGYGFYPWGYGGLGFGGYYGGYYDPWYGGGGGYSTYYSGQSTDDGALRLKVKPREASVYVDGYYAGVVDDFDGVFQRLHLSSGPHRIEIRQPNHDSLSFDVRIEPDQTVTYRGELTKAP